LERFHQTLKREEIYRPFYDSPQDAREKLTAFRECYDQIRPHWALEPAEGGDVLAPHEVYVECKLIVVLPRWQGWAKAARKKLDEAMQQDAESKQAA
jgi:transposase InsO family protein